MSCKLCKSLDNDELYSLESTFTYQNRKISFWELLERKVHDEKYNICKFCLLKLKAKFILRQERTWANFEPYIYDDGIAIGNTLPLYTSETCCENCFTKDQASGLYEMLTTSFRFDGRNVTFVDCFKFCIGLPPEEQQRPVMCHTCMRAMKADYLKKHHAPSYPSPLYPKTNSKPSKTAKSTAGMHLVKINMKGSKGAVALYESESESESEEDEEEAVKEPMQTTVEIPHEMFETNKTDDEYVESENDNEPPRSPTAIREILRKENDVGWDAPVEDDTKISSVCNGIVVKIEPELMIADQASQSSPEDDGQMDYSDTGSGCDDDDLTGMQILIQDSAAPTRISWNHTGPPRERDKEREREEFFVNYYIDPNVKNRVECKYCPVFYQSKHQLHKHVDQRHMDQLGKPFSFYTDTASIVNRQLGDTTHTYLCTICRVQKPSYREFKLHVFFEHCEPPSWTVLRCDVCEDGVFDNPMSLYRHVQRQHDARKSEPMHYQGKPMKRI